MRRDGMVEVANAGALWAALELPREYLVFVAIVACDACPRGVPQVGAKTVIKAIRELLDKGETRPSLDQVHPSCALFAVHGTCASRTSLLRASLLHLRSMPSLMLACIASACVGTGVFRAHGMQPVAD